MNEFERIDTFVKQFDRIAAPFGPGDDAAVLPRPHTALCVSTDAVVEGVHFTRKHFSPEDIGHKALAVNLSDLAAMGAKPAWALCALGLPHRFSANELERLGQGMAALARAHQVSLVGGNVTSSPVLSLTLTVAGTLDRKPLLRSTARQGDHIYVSGLLGLASAGLTILAPGHRRAYPRLTEAQRRPTPHVAWARAAAPFVNAAIDVSDGLLQDLTHLARASGVGIDVHRACIAIDPELRAWAGSDEVALKHALTGGEDYVVAVTVAQRRVNAFAAAMARHGFSVFAVGRVTDTAAVTLDGQPTGARLGFQHFQ